MNSKKTKIFIYVLTVIISFLYIFGGSSYFTRSLNLFSDSSAYSLNAKITKIRRVELKENDYMFEAGIESPPNKLIHFNAKILSGEDKGKDIKGVQYIDGYMSSNVHEVKKGDNVYLYYSTDGEFAGKWMFADFNRFNTILLLAFMFFALLILFGKMQGFNTIVSLGFTCAAVLLVFIPAVLSGHNIYLWTIITCVYTITMTLIIVYGINKKSIGAALGCFTGVLLAGIITLIMDKALKLTGLLNAESYQLTQLSINLKAVIFGAILIGAMGAIMDISISISSSLFEVRENADVITIPDLITSGFNIGRDILGTMSNTLVLAYIGSSLSVILVLIVYSPSIMELLNREQIIVELLQSLVGIISILGTIPLTAIICSFLYGAKNIYTNNK